MEVRTLLTPGEIALLPTRDLRGTVCVVFDVLRATSTILAALVNGAKRIFPVLTPAEALALREERFPDALLGGERNGVRIDGFDLGNSPREYTAHRVGGRDLITTTTNGTVALRACVGADAILAAGLVNLDATARWLADHASGADTILLVCAGTGTRFALEDGLAAGALATSLTGVADDATRAMLALHHHHGARLLEALQNSENGRRLVEIGLGDDVAWCTRLSVLDEVALLHDGGVQSARNLLLSPQSGIKSDLPTAPDLE